MVYPLYGNWVVVLLWNVKSSIPVCEITAVLFPCYGNTYCYLVDHIRMKLASLSTSQRGSSLLALTNDHSYIYYLICLSNAQHETREFPCTAPIECYCPQATGLKNGVLPIVECLLSLSNAQHETHENPCTALVEYYCPQATGIKKGVLPIVECLLSLEQWVTVEQNSLYDEKWMIEMLPKLFPMSFRLIFDAGDYVN